MSRTRIVPCGVPLGSSWTIFAGLTSLTGMRAPQDTTGGRLSTGLLESVRALSGLVVWRERARGHERSRGHSRSVSVGSVAR